MKLVFLVLCLALVQLACSSSDKKKDEQPVPEVLLSQAQLDSVRTLQFGGLSGVWIEGTDSVPTAHVEVPGFTADSTNRSLYTSYPKEMPGRIIPGTLLAKHVYRRNANGTDGERLAVFVMHKQNTGYFTQGGDWDYYVLPASSVTAAHPNGQLAEALRKLGGYEVFRKAAYCADCHARGGADYLFSRR
jgi:hypothetical protein